jgi:hypothetical protein
MGSRDQDVARRLLQDTSFPRDKLPYTDEFERLYAKAVSADLRVSKFKLMQLFFQVAKQGGLGGRKSSVKPPQVSLPQAVFVGRWLGGRLARRDSLPYSQEFEPKYEEFCRRFGVSWSKSEFWLAIDAIAKKARGAEWREQLQKSQESALLGVEVYNKPLVKFKTANYIVMMIIAWTALFHAIFARLGYSYFYPEKIDGEEKAWDLAKCIKEFYGSVDTPKRQNLKFFIGLRNRIEHRSMPALDDSVFGECQAMLFNYEDLLCEFFGDEESLVASMSLAMQFSKLRSAAQEKSIRRLRESTASDVADYVERFRSSLSSDVSGSLEFAYKVFLIPKVVNRESASDEAVEFVKFDPSNPEDQGRLQALVKPTVAEVANAGRLKAKDVCAAVEAYLQERIGPSARFSPSYHHAKAWAFYGVRPRKGAANPAATKRDFCHYDEAHQDYVYTTKWRDFLHEEVKKPGQLDRILAGRTT